MCSKSLWEKLNVVSSLGRHKIDPNWSSRDENYIGGTVAVWPRHRERCEHTNFNLSLEFLEKGHGYNDHFSFGSKKNVAWRKKIRVRVRDLCSRADVTYHRLRCSMWESGGQAGGKRRRNEPPKRCPHLMPRGWTSVASTARGGGWADCKTGRVTSVHIAEEPEEEGAGWLAR